MKMYASNAGKSGGEFFTPAEVSELLTRIGTVGKTEINKVYEVIFDNVGMPEGFSDTLAKQTSVSKFHNSLYDSFIYWCLLLDYKTEINCMFR